MTIISNDRGAKIGQEPIEIDFLIIVNNDGVEKELISSDI